MQLLPVVQPLFSKLPEWLGSVLLRYAPFASVRPLIRFLITILTVSLNLWCLGPKVKEHH